MTVYPVGTEVTFSDTISGRIVGIWIQSSNRVNYQIAWWDEGSYRNSWFDDFEFSTKQSVPGLYVIGFKKEGE